MRGWNERATINPLVHRTGIVLFLLCLAGQTALAAAEVNLIRNGGFEENGGITTSTFAGWTAQTAVENGTWWVQEGTTPTWYGVFRGAVPAPPQGTFAAMTNQAGSGRRLLYQDIFIPTQTVPATLSFQLYLNNSSSSGWVSQPTLDYLPTTTLNQQFRADLIDPSAPVDSLGSSVLLNVYATAPGNPLVSGYTTVIATVPVSLTGRFVRLRFAEVDNRCCLVAGVDDVKLLAQVESIPTLSLPAMAMVGAVLALLSLRLLRTM